MAAQACPNPDYRYQPKQADAIVVRAFNFDFPDDLDPIWAPAKRVRSHLFNGFSLTMPYLEPYLIKSMQEASKHIGEPRLLQRSLRTQLAYNAGFECMTNGFTHWFIHQRVELWGHNCPWVASFWVMHMVEETEHKTVAFDTYMAYSGAWLPRAIGVFHGSFHVLGFGFIAMVKALRKDGLWLAPRTMLEVARELGTVLWNVGPYLLRALLPWHDPRGDEDPQWQKDWVRGHARLPPGAPLPLLDTAHPDIPVPFAPAAGD